LFFWPLYCWSFLSLQLMIVLLAIVLLVLLEFTAH